MPTEPLDIFPLKITTSQALLVFIECAVDEYAIRLLFNFLHQHGISITCLLEGPADGNQRNLILVISEKALKSVEGELEVLSKSSGAKALLLKGPVAVIRILGPHFDIRPGITGKLYGRLERAGIKVLANSTTVTTSLLIINQNELEKTQRELRTIFRPPKGY